MDETLLLQVQKALGDDYEIVRELSGAGMSRVFVARQIRLNRDVVVKVLPPDLAAGIKSERFEREIQVAARLQHPHIVPVLSAGSRDRLLYYTMPFVNGPSLSARLKGAEPLSLVDSVAILRDVADALSFAHSEGIVHRDVKPQNILLPGHHAVVLDFGVAKALTDAAGDATLTSTGLAIGTPLYMAPEQAVASPDVDARADIYALGVVAYELLTRRPLFGGPSPQAVMAAHVTSRPIPAIEANPSLPEELSDIVMRCLEKDPAKRWQSAEELCEALNDFGARFTPSRKEAIKTPHRIEVPPVVSEDPARSPVSKRRIWSRGRMAIAALSVAVIAAAPFLYRARATTSDSQSLVVMPFSNASGKDLEFFTDGMTEEVITNLVKIDGLRVTSPASTFALKDNTANARSVGSRLGVDYVLEGVVRRSGSKVRINARLVNVKKGSYAWSSSYDRDLDDVFDLQAGISRDIARALTLRLVPGQTGSLENRSSSDLAAYDYYLKGNAAARGFTEDSLRLAISYYDSALKIDPRYARAYAGIATVYYNLADDFWLPNRSYPLVRQNALKAISLDDKNADAYGLLASYELAYGWNWEEAYSHARRAVELNRNSSFAHLMLAWYSIVTNDESGAVREAQTVATLDPYSFIIGGNVITLMRAAGRHDLAIGESRRMLAAGVGPPPTLRAWISWDMMLSGDNAAARTQLDSALALDPSCCRRTRALLLAHTGHIIEGRQLLDSIVESRRAAGAYYRADWIAEVHAALGDANAMFASLDQAWTDRSLGLPLLAHNAEFRRYSSDPKFVELKRRLRLPP